MHALLLLGSLLGTQAQAANADQLRSLIEQGQYAQAYAAGKAAAAELGQPDFDFFFGVAAVSAGHAGEGIFALERFLLQYPAHHQARLELARGYFVLGENVRAREEFEALQQVGLSPAEADLVERYLDAIRARESRYQPTASAYLELGLGIDSNINAGPSGASISLPNLGPVLLNSQGVKQGGTFTTLAAGAQGTYPLAPGLALFGSVSSNARLHNGGENRIWDQTGLGGSGGLAILSGDNLWRVGGGYNSLSLQNDAYLNAASLFGEWQRQLGELDRLNLGLQWADLRYQGDNRPRSSTLTTLGGAWTHAFIHPYQPALTLSASYGQERSERNRPDFSRDIWSLRAALNLVPAPKWGLSAGVGFQEARHEGPMALLATTRQDRVTTLDAAVSYRYSQALTLRAELQGALQKSNVDLYEYDRSTLAFKARYEFR